MRIIGRTLLLVCAFACAMPASAQFGTIADQLSNLGPLDVSTSIELRSISPRPGETVTAKLNDYGIQSDAAEISWYYNGVEQTDFYNQRVFTFTAGALGDENQVEVRLTFPDGRVINARAIAPSAHIDIILEPDTYVPQFYAGRPLPTNNSTVRATAMVSTGAGLNAETYVYKWSVGNTILQGGALRGGRTVQFEVPFRNGTLVRVEVFDLSGKLVGEESIGLPEVRPELLFYERSSLYGLRTIALGSQITLTDNPLTLQAVPYNLDTETLLGENTLLRWRANYRDIPMNATNPLLMTLEPSDVSGSAVIDFRVQDRQQYLQGAEGSISIRNN